MSQKERLKNFFQARPNQWINLPEILNLRISQYGARILELRREGFHIENKIIGVSERQKHTAFRYVPTPEIQLTFSL